MEAFEYLGIDIGIKRLNMDITGPMPIIRKAKPLDMDATIPEDFTTPSEVTAEYCKKFQPSAGIGGFAGQGWEYTIEEVKVDQPN